MFLMTWIILITFIIVIFIMMLASAMSKKTFSDREKCSPFECGFDPMSSARLPFSLQFFLMAIIFLIFDVEIVLTYPLVLTMKTTNLMIWTITAMIFLLILLLGLYHEWNQGTLEWKI